MPPLCTVHGPLPPRRDIRSTRSDDTGRDRRSPALGSASRRFAAWVCFLLAGICPGLAPAHAGARPKPAHSATPPAPALTWPEQQTAYCAAAIDAAEAKHGIPKGLLGTIAKVESGRPIDGRIQPWPWTINADGQGYFFDGKDAAVAWVRQALGRGSGFIDVGCMQVDLQMHPGAFRSLEDAFDPTINADYAAGYLSRLALGESGGNWDIATGLYHSHTPDLAAAYRDRVAAVGAGIVTGIGGPAPLYERALRAGTLHLALAGGGMLILQIGRQPAALPQKHRSACQVVRFLGDDISPAAASACRGRMIRP